MIWDSFLFLSFEQNCKDKGIATQLYLLVDLHRYQMRKYLSDRQRNDTIANIAVKYLGYGGLPPVFTPRNQSLVKEAVQRLKDGTYDENIFKDIWREVYDDLAVHFISFSNPALEQKNKELAKNITLTLKHERKRFMLH